MGKWRISASGLHFDVFVHVGVVPAERARKCRAMRFDKGSDAFEVEAMGAQYDEEGLTDGCGEDTCAAMRYTDQSVCVIVRGSEVVLMRWGWDDDGGEILEVLQHSRTIRHR